jgi:hypothetical protein
MIAKTAFKAMGVFGKNLTKSARSVSKHMNMQHLRSTIGTTMSKGIQGGIRAKGYTGNKLREAAVGINQGLISPSARGMAYSGSAGSKLMNFMKHPVTKTANTSALVVGASAMAGLAFMKGGMSQANDIMMQRYMKDARYSNRMLTQTNLGSSSGNGPLSMGNHVGLSLALSRTRHGH